MKARRGFTLLETLFASAIGAFVFAAILGLFYSVWTLVKGSSDQLQGALRARYVRERYFYNLLQDGDRNYGLINATNIIIRSSEVVAQFKDPSGGRDGKAFPRDSADATELLGALDKSGGRQQMPADSSLQYVYLAVKVGKATYYDRMVVPVFGRYKEGVEDMAEVKEAFGAAR